MTDSQATPAAEHELVLNRLLDAPAEKLYRCWTEPALLKQWFVPAPYTIASAELDLRVGGASNVVMRSPDGKDIPNPGIYLEIVPNRKLVFTDAFGPGWVPVGQAFAGGLPFMVAQVTFEPEGDKTRYIARAWHWTAAIKAQHEQMGFHQGWGICADQLEALAKTL